MYCVLFSNYKGNKDYEYFKTENELLDFLMLSRKEIDIDKIFEFLAELKFGLTTVKLGVAADPEKTEEEKIEDFKGAGEELDQEIEDAEIIRKNKEALNHADKAIATAEEEMKVGPARTQNWLVCTKCKVNKVAPWSKYKICSKCRKPKGTRKYDMSKRRKAKE